MENLLYPNDSNKSDLLIQENDKIITSWSNDSFDCDLDAPEPKKPKIEETLLYQQSDENVKKLIDDWVAEYRKWCTLATEKDKNENMEFTENRNVESQSNISSEYPNYIYNNQSCSDSNMFMSQNYINQVANFTFIGNGNGIQQNLASFPLQQYNQQVIRQKPVNMGYWGPLLRYGTYGVYTIYKNNVSLNKNLQQIKKNVKGAENFRISLSYPLDPPLRIRMPRQAMICTLQSKIKAHLQSLVKIEKDPILHMNINYSNNLEQVITKCGTCPKYLYTKVEHLPVTEREYFTNLERNIPRCQFLSLDGSLYNELKSTNEFYACELQIGDIIIAQGFALWKRRARETCARNAFRILAKQCHLVGSTRYWYGTDYMTACTTDDPSVVPLLPPFLTDPTEPLYKKDEKINESDPNENFDILNPKSIHDFWLYATTLESINNIKGIDPQLLLYQSAEFSQMNLSFEVDSCWDESFACTVMLDKSPAIKVEGLGSLEQACQAAALVLVDKLVDTQPIVTLKELHHNQYMNLETNCVYKDNSFLVHSLMWAKPDINGPIEFHNLSDFTSSEALISPKLSSSISSKDVITDQKDMEYFFNNYAQSSLINPLKMNKDCMKEELWSMVPYKVRKCGLVVMYESSSDGSVDSFLICKQVPHTQLKAMLLKDKSFGAFSLLSEGNLPKDYLSNLNQFICYNDEDVMATTQDQNDNFQLNSVVKELDIKSNLSSEKSSLYIDIINDIPRELIPGLDF